MIHTPVMLCETVDFLSPLSKKEAPTIADCTLGLGGYSAKILETFPTARVFGIDQDRAALEIATQNLARFSPRFVPIHGNFRDMETFLKPGIDAFVFDLGVSNLQLTEPERGFAFSLDGALDMRMNPDEGQPVLVALNSLSAKALCDIFRKYGEEKFAWRIACGIENARKKNHIETTEQLVALIREILPAPVQRKMGGHPARRIFQALRIYVNGELDALAEGLSACLELAAPGAVIVAVDYHSLEDRILKHTFLDWKRAGRGEILTKHPLTPSDEEVSENFKARSAKLRAFRLCGADLLGLQNEQRRSHYRERRENSQG